MSTGNSQTCQIRAENLVKRYQEVRWWGKRRVTEAVSGLDLEIQGGEAYGLVGPNGAGKSSIIKILTGLNRATQGNAWIRGIPVGSPSSRRNLGYLPENPSLIPELTVWETVYTGARLHGLSPPSARQRSHAWIQGLGLAEFNSSRVRNLSKGLAQRTTLAATFASDPQTLILDEPLSGLDPIWRRRVIDLLVELRNVGKTLLFSSHILADVERLADRVGLLYSGRLMKQTHPGELVSENLRAYNVRSRGTTPLPDWNSIQEGQNQWRTHLTPDNIWDGLAALRAASHQIIEVQPLGGDLESVLFENLG